MWVRCTPDSVDLFVEDLLVNGSVEGQILQIYTRARDNISTTVCVYVKSKLFQKHRKLTQNVLRHLMMCSEWAALKVSRCFRAEAESSSDLKMMEQTGFKRSQPVSARFCGQKLMERVAKANRQVANRSTCFSFPASNGASRTFLFLRHALPISGIKRKVGQSEIGKKLNECLSGQLSKRAEALIKSHQSSRDKHTACVLAYKTFWMKPLWK